MIPDAGFSSAASTWLPVEANYETINVETEEKDANSLLQWHRSLISLRRKNSILRDGGQQSFDAGNDSVVAFLRTDGDRKVIVITNFSNSEQSVKMGSLSSRKVEILKSNFKPELVGKAFGETFKVPAYGAFVGEVD